MRTATRISLEVARREDLAARHGVVVSLRPADAGSRDHAVVHGDPVLLSHLVGNLVQNAIRYNRPGGSVEISVDGDGSVRVENSGPVVGTEEIAQLFEPFHRGRATRTSASAGRDGAGLGLSIVRAIARAHGGRVRASPGTDGGLCVVVTLL